MNDDEIRALLHDARETSPMPPQIVARLDDVLADLKDSPAPVLPLRRRLAPRVLAAAAAVALVVGVGVGLQHVLGGSGAHTESADSAGVSPRGPAPVSTAAPEKSVGNGPIKQLDTTGAPDDRQLADAARWVVASRADQMDAKVEKSVTPGPAIPCQPIPGPLPKGTRDGVFEIGSHLRHVVVGPDLGGGMHLVEVRSCQNSATVVRRVKLQLS